MFTLTADPYQKLVIAKMSGFMTVEEVSDFAATEQKLLTAYGMKSGDFVLLVDSSDCIIQSQEVVAAFTHLVQHSPAKARKIAIVRGSSLARSQAQRIANRRGQAQVFATVSEARAWLLEGRDAGFDSSDLRRSANALQEIASMGCVIPSREQSATPTAELSRNRA